MVRKRLYRSNKDKIIAGVCGGIAEHFDTDPIWIRLLAVALALMDGIGIAIYLVAWILIPPDPEQKAKQTRAEKKVSKHIKQDDMLAEHVIGAILIFLGVAFFVKYTVGWFSFRYIWPVAVIMTGAYLLLWRRKDEEKGRRKG